MIGSGTFRPVRPETRAKERLMAVVVAVLALVGAASAALLGMQAFLMWAEQHYAGRVHPNVSVLGVALGGMNQAEAVAALGPSFGAVQAPMVILSDGQRQWAVSWPDAGIYYDREATVAAAMAVGRSEPSLWAQATSWLQQHEVPPVAAVDADSARLALREVGAQVFVPPVEATLKPDGNRLAAVPGQLGAALDEEVTLARLVEGITARGSSARIEIALQPIAPFVSDASPLLAEAERILSQPLELAAYDLLRDEQLSRPLEREAILDWLQVGSGPGGEPELVIDSAAIRATVAGWAAEMGEGRGLRLDEATEQLAAALEAGGGLVALYVTHPESAHVVEPGEVLDRIAISYGFPPALLVEANLDVSPSLLQVGQQLVIPSHDVLWPHMPTPNKRIVVSLSRQRMQVYEDGDLLWDWPVSAGIADAPTCPGTFQVLEKVENAYAAQWRLWMPHFLAVYRAGPDLYNGIHALPINASGVRLWEGLLGRPASYGCIILGVDEAEMLYGWAELGVPVVIEP